ncbi:hypothetical protein PpBr36_05042 [Pyricularia pennisetigena]|uniref:hypothetical protein n=1 Tax=Pyricularia pennisetigena TaxID=1578925 RepID=UPI001154BB3F|nr:hypothetical protein PpBr36_05042 [Pyricularia pennisetigena]TLS26231.1 hypothetical protein PpBr36_05042 [Pyricularia pennisetigena]
MRFSIAATAALFGAAIAAPAPQTNPDPRETILLQKFEAVKSSDGPVTSIYFHIISHREVGVAAFVCKGEDAEGLKPDTTIDCAKGPSENDAYRFRVKSVSDDVFTLTVFHQTAPAFGFWGDINVAGACSVESGVSKCKNDETSGELHVYG